MRMSEDTRILRCIGCGTKNRVSVKRLDQGPVCGKCKASIDISILSRVSNVSDQTFEKEVLRYQGPILLDCWAPWCGPCQSVGPILDELAKEYAGRIKIAKLNVDDNPSTASRYTIQSIPTMMLFNKGTVVERQAGALPKHEIMRLMSKVL